MFQSPRDKMKRSDDRDVVDKLKEQKPPKRAPAEKNRGERPPKPKPSTERDR